MEAGSLEPWAGGAPVRPINSLKEFLGWYLPTVALVSRPQERHRLKKQIKQTNKLKHFKDRERKEGGPQKNNQKETKERNKENLQRFPPSKKRKKLIN